MASGRFRAILASFSFSVWTILNDRYIPIQNSYNNAVTQCHVDGAQRAWAICDIVRKFCEYFRMSTHRDSTM